MFKLNTNLDTNALAEQFAQAGRVSIENFLETECADALYQDLRARKDWLEILNNGDQLIELNRDIQRNLTEQQRADLAQITYDNARNGFQYRYETIRVPDLEKERVQSDDVIARFASWISAGEARAFLRTVTAGQDILFADAQATAYSPGHFLTGHDDNFAGKNRHSAYVFGLTPVWRPEWGGLLLFHESDNHFQSALVPDFNRINLFKVPQMHSVSEVTRSAAYRRYSITGWLRTQY
jgi:SM-20-related protein